MPTLPRPNPFLLPLYQSAASRGVTPAALASAMTIVTEADCWNNLARALDSVPRSYPVSYLQGERI
jgi:hypothetical protein